MTERMDEQELIRRVQTGDEVAFSEILTAYKDRIVNYLYQFTGDYQKAVELSQETFLRVFQKIDTYQEGRRFEAWLLQVTRNLCIDHYRKEHARRRELECATPVDELPLAAAGAEEAVHASDLKDILSRCVERLADRQRTIFVMRHYSQLKNEEIARALDISIGTVKSLHFTAIQTLRILMEPYMGCRT